MERKTIEERETRAERTLSVSAELIRNDSRKQRRNLEFGCILAVKPAYRKVVSVQS
jgi:hypothetical protein